MQWTTDKDTSSPPEVFSAVAPAGSRGAVLEETWEFFGTVVLPLNAGVTWDHFRVEIWADTGRVLLFPADKTKDDRVEKAGVCLNFAELQARYEDLEDLDEDSFEAELNKELQNLAAAILAAAPATRRAPGLPTPRIPVEVWEAEESCPTARGTV